MDFIVGGKAQGKRSYVMERYGVSEGDFCDGAVCTPEELREAAFIDHFHIFLRRFPEYTDLSDLSLRGDTVVICDEVGGGVVPVEEEERRWRENAGRIGCRIAAEANCVVRVVFGMPVRLK